MFCPQCGTNNPHGNFCAACGTPISVPQPVVQPAEQPQQRIELPMQKQKTPINKGIIAIIAGVLAVIILIFGSSFAIKAMSKPQNIAKKYAEALRDQNYAKVYSMLEIDSEQAKTLSEANFVRAMNSLGDEAPNINTFQIKGATTGLINDISNILDSLSNSSSSSKNKNLIEHFTIEYTRPNTTTTRTLSASVAKQPKNKYLLIPQYKIKPNDWIVTDYAIIAPKSMEVTMDGLTLVIDESSGYSSNENQRLTVPLAFRGTYPLTATSGIMEDYESEVTLERYGSHTLSGLSVKEDIIKELDKKTEQIISKMVADAMAGNEVAVNHKLTASNEAVANIMNACSNFKDRMPRSGGLKKYEITEFNSRSEGKLESGSRFRSNMGYIYDYSYAYTTFRDEETEQEYSNRIGSVTITYAHEDGEWVVYAVSYSL